MTEASFCACGDHAFVALGRGYVVLVSPEDAEILAHHWSLQFKGRRVSALRNPPPFTGSIGMHRAVLGADRRQWVDHRNGDALDNRRPNLRLCTHAENNRNRVGSFSKKSGLPKGVYRHRRKYRAMIYVDGERHYLGSFETIAEAQQAYADAAPKYHGEFARVA